MESAFSKTSGLYCKLQSNTVNQLHAVTAEFLVKVSRVVNKKMGSTD